MNPIRKKTKEGTLLGRSLMINKTRSGYYKYVLGWKRSRILKGHYRKIIFKRKGSTLVN